MSDKMQDAISRLRRMKGCRETSDEIYPLLPMGHGPLRDKDTLAEAYLAEHPADDGELMDYDFLDGLLPSKLGRGWIVNESLSVFSSRRGFVLIAGQGGANDSEESFAIREPIKTRGELRLLLKALSVEVKS